MRLKTLLALGVASVIVATPAFADEGPAPAADDQASAPIDANDIIVTARQRSESLKNVPIAITALTGDELRDKQITTVKDIAAYTPGLNINSDSVGRAFVSIRGIGTTLIDSVQPGVGIFIDGIYQPNTSYLNSPIVDVARIEVLRGPQGTLFGNNTLGGAINVITRQPGNEWEGRFDATAAGTDSYYSVSGSVSGPIARDLLSFRVGASYHVQDGFMYNTTAHGNMNPLDQRSIGGTLRFTPAPWATITANANYDRVEGGSTAYAAVSGPTDYRLNGATNVLNSATIKYQGYNLKGEFDLDAIRTKLTAVAAYNQKDFSSAVDGDYSPIDLLRATGTSRLITKTAEVRFDTKWNDHISTLIGVFANRYTQRGVSLVDADLSPLFGLPAGTVASNSASGTFVENNQRAIFGTLFLTFGRTDIAIGGRYDHQKLTGSQVDIAAVGATPVTFIPPVYEKSQFQPRVTLTQRWTPNLMTYASVAKGIRGGGQNGPGTQSQNLLYKGDSVWTYEVGAKASVGNLSFTADVFYNDYRDFIGQNALAPNSTGAGFVAINLNTGKVKSYGAELEAHWRVTPQWRIDGGVGWVHARITDDSEYFAVIGDHVSSNRIIFTPDYNFNLNTTYTVPVGPSSLVFDGGVVAKGSRIGSSLDPNVAPRLAPYLLANGSIMMKFSSGFSIGVFGTNLLDKKYIESYLDKSALVKAGLGAVATNLAIQGDRRRYGVRASFRF